MCRPVRGNRVTEPVSRGGCFIRSTGSPRERGSVKSRSLNAPKLPGDAGVPRQPSWHRQLTLLNAPQRRPSCHAKVLHTHRNDTERVRRRKPLLAPLQETNWRTAMSRDLRSYRRAIMLNDGPRERQLPKVKSRQRRSAPLRGVLDRSPPARPTSVQLNHATAVLPPVPVVAHPLAPIPPRFIRRAAWPPGPAKLAPFFAATDTRADVRPEHGVAV